MKKIKFINEIIFGICCWIVGFAIQLLLPEGVPTLQSPQNIQVGIVFSVFILLLYIYGSKYKIIKWLSSPSFSIVSMLMVAILILCMGLIPQENSMSDAVSKLGLNSVVSTWYFAFSMAILLINLGLVMLRHTIQFNRKNIAFILNHFGLWLTLTAGYLGAGDIVRLRTECEVGGSCDRAIDNNNIAYHLPFSITLNKFERKDYTPTLVSIHKETNEYRVVSEKLKVNESYNVNNESFKIISFDTLKNEINGVRVQWNMDTILLTTGLGTSPIQVATLGNDSLLLFKRGSAKSYTSFITLNGKSEQLGVNRPIQYKSWTIYQTSYVEQEDGKVKSYFELVRDPWIPIVYIGFFMILIGAFFLFWEGKKSNKLTDLEIK